MSVQIQIRRGTAAEWTSADPVLAIGELGAETDTSNFKIGDGTSVWSGLPYSHAPHATGIYPGFDNAYFTLLPTTGTNNAYFGVLGEMQLLRMPVSGTVTVSALECRVTTAGGGSAEVRMGIYRQASNGKPGALVIDAGTADITTTGTKSLAISQVLTPDVYFVALVSQNWTGTRPDYRGQVDGVNILGTPMSVWPEVNATGGLSVAELGVSGALPATVGTLGNVSEGRRAPMIAVKVSV